MNVLVLDGRMGASGDMFLGALVAAGADPSVLDVVELHLPIRYAVERTDQIGIKSTRVRVKYTGDDDDVEHRPHSHDHEHSHDHRDGHEHCADAEGRGPTRTFAEIRGVIEEMDVSDAVGLDAVETFRLLAEAESAVHGTDLESTHVHEVGADDAIADIVGTALLVHDLGPDRVVTTTVNTGYGEAEMAHGTYPIPPPAVMEIAERADYAIGQSDVEGELLTPTGAALLAHYADGVGSFPSMRVESVGYGAGARRYPSRPNVLRAVVGSVTSAADASPVDTSNNGGNGELDCATLNLSREPIALVETTVDDVTPEVLGSLQDAVHDVGGLDVSITPTTMKKSRPGHVVQAVAKPERTAAVAATLAEETGSLGVRVHEDLHRWVADREVATVEIEVDGEFHQVGVKVATDADSTRYDVSAEFDDAKRVADQTGLPVRTVMRRAELRVQD